MLRDLAGKSSLPWCIIGDFNDIMAVEEKRGVCSSAKAYRGFYQCYKMIVS